MAWVRLLVALVVLVLAVLFLRQLPTFIVLVLVVSGTWWGISRLRAADRIERRTGTELLGLRRETSDPFGLVAYPVQLFRRSDQMAVDEVSWGSWRQIDVRIFGATAIAPVVLAPADASVAAAGRAKTGFAGVLTNLGSDVPAVVLEPEVLATAFARVPALGRATTGDGAFDARWTVWTDDPSFASALLTPELRTWLTTLGEEWGFELSARIALVYGRRPDHPDVVAVLELLAGFLRRMPQDLLEPRPPAV
jgi:hypothetical protein